MRARAERSVKVRARPLFANVARLLVLSNYHPFHSRPVPGAASVGVAKGTGREAVCSPSQFSRNSLPPLRSPSRPPLHLPPLRSPLRPSLSGRSEYLVIYRERITQNRWSSKRPSPLYPSNWCPIVSVAALSDSILLYIYTQACLQTRLRLTSPYSHASIVLLDIH